VEEANDEDEGEIIQQDDNADKELLIEAGE
jgi:hypothetical protein